MGNLSSIARPYARAAFEYAKAKQELVAWKAFLKSAAEVACDEKVASLLANPVIKGQAFYQLFHEVLASKLNTERDNFLRLLALRKRFDALPEIARSFNAAYDTYEKISNVRLTTAIDIKEDFRRTLTSALSQRLSKQITLQCDIDPAILGGAIIHIGDRVIDGSIRGKLIRLLEFSLR